MFNSVIPLHRSIRTKLVGISIVVEIIMLGLLLTNSMRLLNQTLEEQTRAKVEAVSPLLNSALSARLFERDHVGIIEILDTLLKSKYSSFEYIVVYDNRGQAYAQAGNIDLHNMPLINQHVSESVHTGIFHTRNQLILGKEKIGEVRYGLSLQSLIASRDSLLRQGLFIATIEVILTFLLLSIGGYLITRHIHTLMAATQEIAAGNNSIQIPVNSTDEIGLLASNFNTMSLAIHERIDALHLSEKALFAEKELAEVTLHSIADGVITTNVSGLIQYMNPVAEQLTGWKSAEASDRHIIEIFRTIDEITLLPLSNTVIACLRDQSVVSGPNRSILLSMDNWKFALEETASPILDRDGKLSGAVLVFHDVSASREFARQLEYQASHDALTGLVNRSEFEKRTEEVLRDAQENGFNHAMCYLDLDQFKIVNDTCGHTAGDQLLRQLADHLTTAIRDIDTVGRLGGDEFGLLIRKCSMTEAQQIAETLRDQIRQFRFLWNDKIFEIGVSIGVVPIRPDSSDVTEIFSAADVACYIAKDKGRNQIHVHQINDIEHARRQGEMQWSHRITDALANNRFVLYYQKISPISPNSAYPEECEILLRMLDEEGKVILPAKFIAVAERYNLISEIDRWVVRNAFKLISQNGAQSICNGSFGINLSGQSIGDSDFLKFVIQEIHTSKVAPSRIYFEVTETAAIANLNRAIDFISELKSLGCKFALDDFGSGLSSFAYLRSLPVDYLKIDGLFVKNIATDSKDRAMVTAIHQVGHTLGIHTIAEFVENQEIYNVLKEIGVDLAQGYYLHMPEQLIIPNIGRSNISVVQD